MEEPLDTISYAVEEGSVVKTVVKVVDVPEVSQEITALEAQLTDIIAGNTLEPTPEAEAAILNYQEQLDILRGI